MTRADDAVSPEVAGRSGDHESRREADRVERNRGMDQGMSVLSYLIAGVLFWGGLGWLVDHLLHTSFVLPIGIVLGAALGVYVIIKRFGDLGSGSSPSGLDQSVPPISQKEK